MPVHFKGKSEYDTHYKWFDSYKSKSFRPTADQAMRMAGLSSADLGFNSVPSEPPLQRKKKCEGPMTSLSTNYYQGLESPASDDFALLGANDKFVENVKYKAKSRGVSPPKQQKLADSKTEKEKENIPSAPKPAPVVNTDIYKKPANVKDSPKVTTPMAPREPKNQSAALKQQVTGPPKQSVKSPSKSKVKKSLGRTLDVNKQESLSKLPLKDKKIDNMNEFVQTNMEKGVADSAPEAPAEYSLKYKAGVAPPRPKRKVSEYQKSFDWKVGGKASPLLAAEQIIYNSNPQVAPFRKDVIPKKSEYDAQFQNWKLSEPKEKPVQAAEKASKKRSKVTRSKSMGALSPDKMPAAGSTPLVTSDNKRLTKETPDIQVKRPPPIPHGQLRRVKSEYSSNFKSPNNFDYVRGAWRGANPPHLQAPEPDNTGTSGNAPEPCFSNWFAEVVELRRKAQEYRKRAQGTHFSREHLVQLMAQQANAWDVQSTARSGHSTLSALSLELGSARNNNARKDSARATMASDEQVEEQDLETEVEGIKTAWQDEDGSAITSSSSVPEEIDGGRVPTPQWKQKPKKHRSTRHHLDLTTPAVGGAILTSPPQMPKSRKGRTVTKSLPVILQDVNDDDDDDTLVEEPLSKPAVSKTNVKKSSVTQGEIIPTPTFGMPSRDTHYLRDDEVSCDVPMQTSYVHSPLKKVSKRPPGIDIPSTIKEGFGQTYNNPGLPLGKAVDQTVDDDVLSVSARSVASSCSMAAETLERAKKRKEEFWGKQGVAAR